MKNTIHSKINFRKILKWLFYLILATLLGIILLFGFYGWIIYGIHPSDEGQRSVSCEYDTKRKVYTSIEIITIKAGKRVVTEGDEGLCDLHTK